MKKDDASTHMCHDSGHDLDNYMLTMKAGDIQKLTMCFIIGRRSSRLLGLWTHVR